MFPSRAPLLYVLQLLLIAVAICGGMYLGCVVLQQPLALLLILALNFLPEYPLVPETEEPEEEEDPCVYNAPREGTENRMGFVPDKS